MSEKNCKILISQIKDYQSNAQIDKSNKLIKDIERINYEYWNVPRSTQSYAYPNLSSYGCSCLFCGISALLHYKKYLLENYY